MCKKRNAALYTRDWLPALLYRCQAAAQRHQDGFGNDVVFISRIDCAKLPDPDLTGPPTLACTS